YDDRTVQKDVHLIEIMIKGTLDEVVHMRTSLSQGEASGGRVASCLRRVFAQSKRNGWFQHPRNTGLIQLSRKTLQSSGGSYFRRRSRCPSRVSRFLPNRWRERR